MKENKINNNKINLNQNRLNKNKLHFSLIKEIKIKLKQTEIN